MGIRKTKRIPTRTIYSTPACPLFEIIKLYDEEEEKV
jgi:hypothetical protein